MSSTAFLNLLRSSTQKPQSPTALTDADLGALYIRANSPKNSGDLSVFLTSLLMII